MIFDIIKRKFTAIITINPQTRKFLGHFDCEIQAALIYDKAARLYHGKFALCNFYMT